MAALAPQVYPALATCAHAALARCRSISYAKVKTLPAWLGKCVRLEQLCAPATSNPVAATGANHIAAATQTPRAPVAARVPMAPSAAARLRTPHTHVHRGAARRIRGGYVCTDARRPARRDAKQSALEALPSEARWPRLTLLCVPRPRG